MSFSEFNVKDYEVIARDYADLKEAARKRCKNEEELDLVQKAFDFANEAHKNVRRRSGEPYILHPIAVAKIVVSDIGLGCKSICSALLHDVVEDTDYTVEDIRSLFGDKIASIVSGLTKIKGVLDTQGGDSDAKFSQSLQAENFKRILLTLEDDVRVVLIKLADRLHNCRTIEYMPEYKRDKILSETMFIFIPLAHRLGLYSIKSEMENIWLRFKEPEAYNDISARINRDMSDKDIAIDEFIRPIDEALKKAGFDYYIKKRVKTPYSIWKKMRTKNVTFDQIYDIYAVRIIFNPDSRDHDIERDECYHVFSIITGIYRYKPERMRDWVKQPKSNGYEALHCTLMSEGGMWVEVQIRTRRMDDIAERGIAAHWAYKQDGYIGENDSEMDKWLDKIKSILVSPDVNALELLDIIHNDLTTSEIVVFTPKGDQRSIQKGACALDFAYMIHTHIGHKAIAAKVNAKLVPLSYELKMGDKVEIITAENSTPKREWLQFLKTRYARNAVMDFFKSERPRVTAAGRKSLEERLEQDKIKMTEELVRHHIVPATEVSGQEELFFRYGLGLITYEDIKSRVDLSFFKNQQQGGGIFSRYLSMLRRDSGKDEAGKGPGFPEGKFDRTAFYINSPSDPHKYILANCCKPIAGDPVIGFLSPDGGSIVVHKKGCSVGGSFATKHGDWLVLPQWAGSEDQSFLVRISLQGLDRMGLLNDITKYVSVVMGVNMRRLNLSTDQGIFDGYIDLYVHDKEVLSELIGHLKAIDGIQSVQRKDI